MRIPQIIRNFTSCFVFLRLLIIVVAAHIAPPPPLLPSGDSDSSTRRGNAAVPNVDEIAARDAVLSYVSRNHCWGLSAAREMTILDITPSSAFQVNNCFNNK